MKNSKLPTHYRLIDILDETGILILLEKFEVIKETKKCYWVESENSFKWCNLAEKKKLKQVRLVSKSSAKRYCYPTIELAFNSFRIRKIKQVSILEKQLDQAAHIVKNLENIKNKYIEDFRHNVGINIGHTEYTDGIRWE